MLNSKGSILEEGKTSLPLVQGECEQGELLHRDCSQTCSALGSLGGGPRCADLAGLQLCLV